MQLQKEVKKEQNAKISIQVTVEKSAVNETREEIIKDFEKDAKIPGFRKGKVPRQLVLSRFSKNIKNKTISMVLSRSIEQILKEEDFKPVSDPVVTEMGDLTVDGDFSFKAEFDVIPEINLVEYKGITSEKYIYTVSKDRVNEEIENLRKHFATLVSLEGKAKIGDYVVIDYEEVTPEGNRKNQKKNQTIFLDNNENELAKQLVGLSKGDEKNITINHKYIEDDKEKEYIAQLHVAVNDVKKKELPELNDDFAKDISDTESLEELKTNIKQQLEKEAERLSEDKTKEELLKKLTQKTRVELPETMVNSEINRLLYDIAPVYRIDLEKLKKDEKKYEEYRNNLMPRAVNNLKHELILAEIAKKENLNVMSEESDEEIEKYAKSTKQDFQTVKTTMFENKSTDNLKHRLKLNKALDLVYKNAKFNSVKKLKYEKEEGGNN